MMYSELLEILNTYKCDTFASFQRKLIATKYAILGVTTPNMRKIAKECKSAYKDILNFPDEYFEVVFIKLICIAKLPYAEFCQQVDYAVSLMDNWAHCDCFKAECIKQHKKEFLDILEALFQKGAEFYQRYVLVTFLYYYVEMEYLPLIESYIQRADTSKYYVHMATAWLVAEILTKEYDYGLTILQSKVLDIKTHNKAIQKAIESYRITTEQKEYLRSLKIKNK